MMVPSASPTPMEVVVALLSRNSSVSGGSRIESSTKSMVTICVVGPPLGKLMTIVQRIEVVDSLGSALLDQCEGR